VIRVSDRVNDENKAIKSESQESESDDLNVFDPSNQENGAGDEIKDKVSDFIVNVPT